MFFKSFESGFNVGDIVKTDRGIGKIDTIHGHYWAQDKKPYVGYTSVRPAFEIEYMIDYTYDKDIDISERDFGFHKDSNISLITSADRLEQ